MRGSVWGKEAVYGELSPSAQLAVRRGCVDMSRVSCSIWILSSLCSESGWHEWRLGLSGLTGPLLSTTNWIYGCFTGMNNHFSLVGSSRNCSEFAPTEVVGTCISLIATAV